MYDVNINTSNQRVKISEDNINIYTSTSLGDKNASYRETNARILPKSKIETHVKLNVQYN